MASSFFNTCCTHRKQELDQSERGQHDLSCMCTTVMSSVSDLLRSPVVAQRPQLV